MNWGSNITIITTFDIGFFPGFCGLYNSACCNGFKGSFFCINPDRISDKYSTSSFKNSEFKQFKANNNKYSHYVKWLIALKDLPAGNYLYLDCDTIIERPLGFHLELIDEAPIVSTECGKKYDPFDVLTARQCIETGLSTDLKPFPYINDGFFAFQLPRDQKIIEQWVDLSLKHLIEINEATTNPRWYFLEQDILNIILRQQNHKVFSISSNHIEIDNIKKQFRFRPFPWTKQDSLRPKDQLKYVIHGAGLRRPWILPKDPLRRFFECNGFLPLVRRFRKKITPYERAWYYYSFSEEIEIQPTLWIEENLKCNREKLLWKIAYR